MSNASRPSGSSTVTHDGEGVISLHSMEKSQLFDSHVVSSLVDVQTPGSTAIFSTTPSVPISRESNPTSAPDAMSKNSAPDLTAPACAAVPFKCTGLKMFDIQIPERLEQRFEDLQDIFTEPLYNHLLDRRWYNRILPNKDIESGAYSFSMKLRYLGENETTVKLFIVILCGPAAVKKARWFFRQAHVQEELGSEFNIVVQEGLRELTMEIMAMSLWTKDEWRTLCGKRLRLSRGAATRLSTVGGIIMVTYENGSFVFGMTAGHAVRDVRRGGEEELTEGEIDGRESTGPPELQLGVHSLDGLWEVNSDADANLNFDRFIGEVRHDSYEVVQSGGNHDWALFTLLPSARLPNMLNQNVYLSSESGRPTWIQTSAVVLTIRGPQIGQLTRKRSGIFMGRSNKTAQTLDFRPGPGSSLIQGDSGAWVVDPEKGYVYGHLVAIDILGEGYVIPIQATLEAIKGQLDATEVRLPSQAEIQRVLSSNGAKKSVSSSGVSTGGGSYGNTYVPRLGGLTTYSVPSTRHSPSSQCVGQSYFGITLDQYDTGGHVTEVAGRDIMSSRIGLIENASSGCVGNCIHLDCDIRGSVHHGDQNHQNLGADAVRTVNAFGQTSNAIQTDPMVVPITNFRHCGNLNNQVLGTRAFPRGRIYGQNSIEARSANHVLGDHEATVIESSVSRPENGVFLINEYKMDDNITYGDSANDSGNFDAQDSVTIRRRR